MTSSVLHLTVNGTPYELAAPNRRTLVDLLRYDLGLTGTKEACSVGVCGVCSVLLDGRLVASCLLLACQADDHAITSIEGVTAPNGELHPLQQSFIDHAGFQCGSSRLNTWASPSAMWNSLLEVPAGRIRMNHLRGKIFLREQASRSALAHIPLQTARMSPRSWHRWPRSRWTLRLARSLFSTSRCPRFGRCAQSARLPGPGEWWLPAWAGLRAHGGAGGRCPRSRPAHYCGQSLPSLWRK